MRRLLLRLLINAVALYLAVVLVPGIHSEGSWVTFLAMALVFGLVNALVRPILTFLTGLLIILTLGLFSLVINALMLWLASYVGAMLGLSFTVDGFVAAFLGALVISLVNWALTLLVGDHRHAGERSR
ncbi:MAG TPA: phage holin family protein [Anaerolineae bacterium]|nr:phage holin family protein [Anaerolineae bacterium]HOQ98274.1 phage holin family protein [Anaerolineae bacterium]HPL27621.1 phage holin family protein [Anaerolineae bacterium]